MTKPDDQYGLLIDRENRHGTEYIMSIEEGRNCYRQMIDGAVAEGVARKVA
jgi:hypothetical protein